MATDAEAGVEDTRAKRADNDNTMSASDVTRADDIDCTKGKPWRFWAILLSLVVIALLSAVEVTVVSISMPTIVHDLQTGNNNVWIVNSLVLTWSVSYDHSFHKEDDPNKLIMLPQSCLYPITSPLADTWDRRWHMLVSVAIFTLGSGISGAARYRWAYIRSYGAIQRVTIPATALNKMSTKHLGQISDPSFRALLFHATVMHMPMLRETSCASIGLIYSMISLAPTQTLWISPHLGRGCGYLWICYHLLAVGDCIFPSSHRFGLSLGSKRRSLVIPTLPILTNLKRQTTEETEQRIVRLYRKEEITREHLHG